MSTTGDGIGIAAATNNNNHDSINTAEGYHANEVEECNRLVKMCKFFRRRDTLDYLVGGPRCPLGEGTLP